MSDPAPERTITPPNNFKPQKERDALLNISRCCASNPENSDLLSVLEGYIDDKKLLEGNLYKPPFTYVVRIAVDEKNLALLRFARKHGSRASYSTLRAFREYKVYDDEAYNILKTIFTYGPKGPFLCRPVE